MTTAALVVIGAVGLAYAALIAAIGSALGRVLRAASDPDRAPLDPRDRLFVADILKAGAL